jgi:hypothetical protein
MRLRENMEEFIKSRKRRIATNADTDKRILDDSFGAMEAAKAGLSGGRPKLWSLILASKVARLAAAALLIVSIGLVGHRISREHTNGAAFRDAAKSPAEMLTFMSLTMAYRQGGIEAVEKQCEQAVELLGPRTKNLSVRELFEEFNSNGDNPERTEL